MRPRSQWARVERLEEELPAKAAKTDDALTPQQKLLRAAERGQFEALVAAARPAEPVAMVTPEEREAELRAAGRWPAERPQAKKKPAKKPEPKEPERELTPNEQYIDEHCHWRRRGPNDYPRPQHEPGRCLVEYDPIEYFYNEEYGAEEDDEW